MDATTGEDPFDGPDPSPEAGAVPLVYLLFDGSGSTVRAGFNDGCNRAMPEVVATVEQVAGTGTRLAVLCYGGAPAVLVPLSAVGDLAMLPVVPAGGLSSLAAGLRLVAGTLQADLAQLDADGVAVERATVVVLADGPPTDTAEDVRAARTELAGASGYPLVLHLAAPTGEAALAELCRGFSPIAAGDAAGVAGGVVAAVRAALAG